MYSTYVVVMRLFDKKAGWHWLCQCMAEWYDEHGQSPRRTFVFERLHRAYVHR